MQERFKMNRKQESPGKAAGAVTGALPGVGDLALT